MPHSAQVLSSFDPTIEGIYAVCIRKKQEQEAHTLLLPERLSTFWAERKLVPL